jgi:predicted Zn finger-like uncharacterized protein
MFTDCPDCHRQFHINAAQLSAAEGQVICGFCGTRFNAMQSLHDAPTAIPENREQLHNEIPVPQDQLPELEGAKDNPDNEVIIPDYSDPETIILSTPGKTGTASRMLWFSASLVLLLLVAGQLIWFQRDRILGRYPELIPRVRQFCELVECGVFRQRNPDAIKLVNRDVREHPRFENALLVNATMQNQSDRNQPYPNVRFMLYDIRGKQIAHRDFHPENYLDDSIRILEGMSPETPVHFVLEVAGPTDGAVSFEFAFF